MKTKLLFLMATTLLGAEACNSHAAEYPTDTFTAKDGTQFKMIFFAHASLAIEVDGRYIYVDPVESSADYASLPAADLILITHSHYDHLDTATVALLSTPQTEIVCDTTSAEALGSDCIALVPGQRISPRSYVEIEAVPAYNITEGHLQFHPRERQDNGYILTIGGTRIYIAGDTENTSDLKSLKGIDIALLPVNQPYTMTVDQAVDAIAALRPAVFYPYHTGQVEQVTDLERLKREVETMTCIRIRPME